MLLVLKHNILLLCQMIILPCSHNLIGAHLVSNANLFNRTDGLKFVLGVEQGHVHHEVPLIIIILNVVLLPIDDDILCTDDFTQSFYSHFHHQQ